MVPEREIDMDEQMVIQSSAPFIGILSQLIGWTFFLIAL